MKTTSMIKCPNCGHIKEENLPTNMCMNSYTCEKCKKELRPQETDCCVFCSYGDTKCPDKQINPEINERGFTMIEILMVIAIIGILATTILGAVTTARGKAKISKATTELGNLKTAISVLQSDTNKWPNGCPPGIISSPEVKLDTPAAGIKEVPSVGNNGGGCEWTAEDIARWKGPYMQAPIDSWGTSYWFDPDYTPYENCASITTGTIITVIVSFGPNKVGNNVYDCDNIFMELK